MVCEHTRLAELSGYVDGELPVDRTTWWEEHLARCSSCRDQLAGLEALRASLRSHLSPREPSSGFRNELRQRLRAEQRRHMGLFAAASPLKLGLAAAALLALGVGLGRVPQGAGTDRVADQVVANHVRSLEVDHLVDVASSERHMVKPWFAGKLDFSPPVPDLGPYFPLIGGRVDYLDGRPVAALVYSRGHHRINLLVWRVATGGSGCSREPTIVRQGYNLSHGTAAGMEAWAVSDLTRRELEDFLSRWQRAATQWDPTCR